MSGSFGDEVYLKILLTNSVPVISQIARFFA